MKKMLTTIDKQCLLERAFMYVAGSPLKLPLGDNDIVRISDSSALSESYSSWWTHEQTDEASNWLAGALIKLRRGDSPSMAPTPFEE